MADPQKRFSALKRQMQSKTGKAPAPSAKRKSVGQSTEEEERRPSLTYQVQHWDNNSNPKETLAVPPDSGQKGAISPIQRDLQSSNSFRKTHSFETTEVGPFENRTNTVENSIVDRLLPILIVLQLCGLYPFSLKRTNVLKCVRLLIFVLLSFIILAFSAIPAYRLQVQAIVMWIFLISAFRHHRFLEKLDGTERIFANFTGRSSSAISVRLNVLFLTAFIFLYLFLFIVKFVQTFLIYENQTVSDYLNLFAHTMFLFYPAIPVLYYCVCNSTIRFWIAELKRSPSITRNPGVLVKLCELQKTMNNFFCLPIVFYIFWPCSAIMWTAFTFIKRQIDTEEMQGSEDRLLAFDWVFIALQCLIAILCFLTVFITGIITNEKTRSLIYHAVAREPHSLGQNQENSAIWMSLLHSQRHYGPSMCRILKLERKFLLIILLFLTAYIVALYIWLPRNSFPTQITRPTSPIATTDQVTTESDGKFNNYVVEQAILIVNASVTKDI